MSESPVTNQEVEINYLIKNSKGEILDSTQDRPTFKFVIGNNQILSEIENVIKTMKKNEKKQIEISPEKANDIFNLLTTQLSNNFQINDKLTCEIELVDFYDKIKSVYEMTTEEKYNKAKDSKQLFIDCYKSSNYNKAIEHLNESLDYINKINDTNDEIIKFKVGLMLNKCNCLNKIKDYPNAIKVGKQIIELDDKSMKAYYHIANSYSYLDEFEEAEKYYNKLYELIPDKEDEGIKSIRNLIDTRKTKKESESKKKFKALFKQGLYN